MAQKLDNMTDKDLMSKINSLDYDEGVEGLDTLEKRLEAKKPLLDELKKRENAKKEEPAKEDEETIKIDLTKEDEKPTKRSLYLYAQDDITDEDIEKAKEYGLELKGYNEFDGEHNAVFTGSKEAFDKFNKEWLGNYEINPDYFYEDENDFAGDIQDERYSEIDLDEHYEDMAKYVNETIAGRGFEMPNGVYLGIQYEDGKLIAGSITNSGIMKDYQIDYDEEKSLDDNLSDLYDIVYGENYQPESEEEETSDEDTDSLERYRNKVEAHSKDGSARPFNDTLDDLIAENEWLEDEIREKLLEDMIDGRFDKPDDKETYRDWFNRMYQFTDNATWDTLSKEEQDEYLREYLTLDEITSALSDDMIRDWIDYRGYDFYF